MPARSFLSLGFKVFLDDSAIDDGLVDVRTLLASSLEEILRGLLLRHIEQQPEQLGQREECEYKEERAKRRDRQGESAQVL